MRKALTKLVRDYSVPVSTVGGSIVYYPPHDPTKPVYCTGITTAMKKKLYVLGPKRPKPTPVRRPTVDRKAVLARLPVEQKVILASRGRTRGSLVHRQIMERINYDKQTFKKLNPHGIHPFTERFFSVCAQRSWTPLAAEVVSVSPQLRLGAIIDTIMFDRKAEKLLFVELKTSYDGDVFHKIDGAWTGLLPDALAARFPCTPRNRSILQIAAGTLLFQQTTGLKPELCEAWVMRIGEGGEELHQVRNDFIRTHVTSLLSKIV